MLSPDVIMNLLPKVRDFLGYSHNRSFVDYLNRNSDFDGLWHATRQPDHSIRQCRMTAGSEKSRAITKRKDVQL
jgi:hypothetical protein